MSQLRKMRKKVHKEHNLKIKRQKAIFSVCFVFTIASSLIVLVFCAINESITLATIIISGCAWLLFDIVYAYAIKNKWHLLFDECSTGRFSLDCNQTEAQRKKDNWQGNRFKFVISVIILLIHIVLLFCILFVFDEI